MVHVRDALTAPAGTRARNLMRPVLTLSADEPAYAALRTMRERRSHLTLVRDGDGVVGLLTMRDLLDRLLPDPVVAKNPTTGPLVG
jgi:CBS domain containing-hemolysin-like protein